MIERDRCLPTREAEGGGDALEPVDHGEVGRERRPTAALGGERSLGYEVPAEPGGDGVEFEVAVNQVELQAAECSLPPEVIYDGRSLLGQLVAPLGLCGELGTLNLARAPAVRHARSVAAGKRPVRVATRPLVLCRRRGGVGATPSAENDWWKWRWMKAAFICTSCDVI